MAVVLSVRGLAPTFCSGLCHQYVAYVRYTTDIYGLWQLSPFSIMFRAELVGSQHLDRDLAVNTRSTREIVSWGTPEVFLGKKER